MQAQTKLNPTPAGYSRVCPYLMVSDIDQLLTFLEAVLEGVTTERLLTTDGTVRHAELCIGDSMIMIGREQAGYPKQSMTYIFMHDADGVYRKALEHGAVSVMEPADRFYGYRECGFQDPSGHQWWVAQVVENLSKEELAKRSSRI